MTPQEAIENINDILDSPYLYDESIDYQLTTDDIECLEMAKEALEKQIPKKIKTEYITRELKRYRCPACNQHYFDISHKYCHFCGQALDWSDTK